MPTKSPDDRFTAEEACNYLGISRPTLQRRMASGELQRRKSRSGRIWFTRAMLDAVKNADE